MALGPMVVGAGTPALTKDDITKALGYTPPQQDTTYSTATETTAGLMSAEMVTKLNELSTGGGIAASGSDYVRFEDGTQICWGNGKSVSVGSSAGYIDFPVAFSGGSIGVSLVNATNSGNEKIVRTAGIYTTRVGVSCSGGGTVILSYIAVGRWK